MWKIDSSALESQHFGVVAGKLVVTDAGGFSFDQIPIESLKFDFVSSRILCSDLLVVQKLEQFGFFLTDTLIYYKKKLSDDQLNLQIRSQIRIATPADFGQIIQVAEASFQNYVSHFHLDPYLNKKKADQVYTDWARRSCYKKDVADAILVSERDGLITGFGTLVKRNEKAEGLLFAVRPESQGDGIHRDLIRASMMWAYQQGCNEILYSTQLANLGAQKNLCRESWEVERAFYTLHYWGNR